MDLLVQGRADILDHLRGEVAAEQVCEKKARQIYTLIGVAVTVILRDSTAGDPENLARHVTKEACLCVHTVIFDTDVGEQLNVEDILNAQRLLRLG